ncbi:exfoliative toxin A/B [Spiroplasma syrphidicola EA-1]|uniref:Exfoliative toxin A/B n=1 Tax=Spiroplasma syrphidicola EA-1 TaxID=1276229 RepID=R4U3Z6_9MOLU|nr:TDT family transporter [Spiroplasma syrphidicola]AGM26137.1 exfoliative toxin A/B [Spiroplasma syrphidicola EA-1]
MQEFFTRFYRNTSKRPLALSGAALGTATMGNAWGMFNETDLVFSFGLSWLKYITISFAMLVVILMLFKYFFAPKDFIYDFKHPTLSNFIPTILMTCFVISGFYGQVNLPMVQLIIWLSCISLHLIYIICFTIYHVIHFSWKNYLASWFVPPIGIVVACVMSKGVGANISLEFSQGIHQLSQFCWYLGLGYYVVMLPLMIYKYSFTTHLEHNNLPAYGIMAAPPNLLLAGYLSTFSYTQIASQYNLVIFGLAPLAIFFTICVYISMFKTFQKKFMPLFACYTFPLAIGMVAMVKLSTWIITIFPNASQLAAIIKVWALIATITGTTVILFVDMGLIIFSIYHVYYRHDNKVVKNKFLKYFI